MAYTVINNTKQKIWWRDGSWTSGEIDPHAEHQVASNHDANVTLFGKNGSTDVEWGLLWIPNNGTVTVNGEWNWNVRP